MEGAVILGLTAFDLHGTRVIVDRPAAMRASNYDALAPGKSWHNCLTW